MARAKKYEVLVDGDVLHAAMTPRLATKLTALAEKNGPLHVVASRRIPNKEFARDVEA